MAETQTEPQARKLFSSAELVLVKKDLNAIWSRKGIRTLLMGMPLVLVVFLPVVYFVAISLLPEADTAGIPEAIQKLLPAESVSHGYRQFWMDAFTTLICPMLFLSVPVMCAVSSASCLFVGEKENGTLETLFLCSMQAKSIFHVKTMVCVLVSVFISLISFFIFAITVSVADILISAPYFFSLEWLVTVFLLMPALSLFSVVFVSLVLSRVYSVGESLQTMGYLLLPFIALYLVQFTGAFRVSVLLILALAAILMILAIVLFNFSARKFQPEKLLDSGANI